MTRPTSPAPRPTKKESAQEELSRLRSLAREVYYLFNATTGAEMSQAHTKKCVEAEQAARARERNAFMSGIRYVRDYLFNNVAHANAVLNNRYPEIPASIIPPMPEGKEPPR